MMWSSAYCFKITVHQILAGYASLKILVFFWVSNYYIWSTELYRSQYMCYILLLAMGVWCIRLRSSCQLYLLVLSNIVWSLVSSSCRGFLVIVSSSLWLHVLWTNTLWPYLSGGTSHDRRPHLKLLLYLSVSVSAWSFWSKRVPSPFTDQIAWICRLSWARLHR